MLVGASLVVGSLWKAALALGVWLVSTYPQQTNPNLTECFRMNSTTKLVSICIQKGTLRLTLFQAYDTYVTSQKHEYRETH